MNKQSQTFKPSDPKTTIRPVSMEDVTALHPLWPNRTQAEVFRLANRILKQQHQQRGLGVVIILRKKLVGYGQFTLWKKTAEIADLAVLEEYRGQGIGTKLIQHLMQVAKDKYATHAEIGVVASNRRALALYRRLGFEPRHSYQAGRGDKREAIIYLQLALR
jgi:ribosomal protein S18 acetylase RimI-like enzyme